MKCAQTQHLYYFMLQKHEKNTCLPWEPKKTPKKWAKFMLAKISQER